jgi:outer membrane protein OmpA-like peptidoglycan-associated protein
VINFYDQFFQQFAGPAHSHKSQESGAGKPEKTRITRPLLQKQSNYSAPQLISEEVTDVGQPAGEESTGPASEARKPTGLQDCNVVIPFGYNSNEVPESAYASLEQCASMMLQNPAVVMVIKGYSDNAYSDRLRHPIPIDPATLFRSNPPPDSEAFRHPLGALI